MQDEPREDLLGAENERPVVERARVLVGRVGRVELPGALSCGANQGRDVSIRRVAACERCSSVGNGSAKRVEDRVDVVVTARPVLDGDVVAISCWIGHHRRNIAIPRMRHVEQQRPICNRADAVDDFDEAVDARQVVVRNRNGRVFGLVDPQGLSHRTRGRVRGHLAIRIRTVRVAITIVVDVVVADRFVLRTHARRRARAGRIRFDRARGRATIVVGRVVIVAGFAILEDAIAAYAQHADTWCAATVVVWLHNTGRRTTIVVGHVVVVASFAELDRAVAAYGQRSNAQCELPVVERAVIRSCVQIRDIERPRAIGVQTDEWGEGFFRCITRAERSVCCDHGRNVVGAGRVEHGVGEVGTTAAAAVDGDVLRVVRSLQNHAHVSCVGVRYVERDGRAFEDAGACPGNVDRAREEGHEVRDGRGSMRRAEDEQLFIRCAGGEVRRQLAIRVGAVGLSVQIVVNAIAACRLWSATNAGRTRARKSRLRRTRRRTAVTVERVVVVAGFSCIDYAVTAARHAKAWHAGANESGLDGTRGRTAVEVEHISVVAGFSGINASVAAAQAAHAWLARAFPAGFDCAERRAAIAWCRATVITGFHARRAHVATNRRDTLSRTANGARAVGSGVAILAEGTTTTRSAAAIDVCFRAVFHGVGARRSCTRLCGTHAAHALRAGQTFNARACAVAHLPCAAVRACCPRRRVGVRRGRTVAAIVGAGIVVVVDVGRLGDHLGAADAVALLFLTIACRLVWRGRTRCREVCRARTSGTYGGRTCRGHSALRVRRASNAFAGGIAIERAIHAACCVERFDGMRRHAGCAHVIGAFIAVVGFVRIIRLHLGRAGSITHDRLTIACRLLGRRVGIVRLILRCARTIAHDELAISGGLSGHGGGAVRDGIRDALAIHGTRLHQALVARIRTIARDHAFRHGAARAR